MGTKTMSCTLEGPANALATNREANQVVVAGRNVFKIFSIEEEEFVEKLNLRVGKNLNLNFSCADVVWNCVEDHILATAATNGAVLTWNINKTSRSKQDLVFQDHKRTVNKVSFHTTEPHLLLSGSQDGTMKCFDLRRKEATTTFHSLSESVRDVQFSPHHYFVFAAVQENGNVQLWDLRRPDRYDKQFTAHNGPVFSCNWHPEEKKWLATAGRDKTIKVWDIGSKPSLENCIQTIASVAHIKWRPHRKNNIASSSLVVDFSINIWDIRRPYIPFASFNEHKDVATGFAWRQNSHVFLSTSKDCTLYQHVFRDAVRPADRAIPVGLAINNHMDVLHAVSDRLISDESAKPTSSFSTNRPSFFRNKIPNLGEQFRSATSSLVTFSNYKEDEDCFVKTATKYKLSGSSFGDICDHNSNIAAELNRPNITQTWRMLKVMYPDPSALNTSGGIASTDALWSNGEKDMPHETSTQRHSRHNSGNTMLRVNRHVSGAPSNSDRVSTSAALLLGDTPGATEDDSDASDQDHDRTLTNIVSCMGSNTLQGDFFFGDGETDPNFFEYNSPLPPLENSQDWTLPTEAFHPRHPIKDYSPPSDTANIPSTPTSLEDEDMDGEIGGSANLPGDVEDHSKFVTSPSLLTMPSWFSSNIIQELLHFYANKGDVQTAVSLLIVLGDKAAKCIDDATQEQWFTAYIDLLGHYQLWNISNRIIQYCNLSSINSLNQQSTVMHTLCGSCGKPLNRVGWLCDRCKKFPSECSVCHQVVRGLYVWCQGCCHGGHVHHMQEWLKENPWCPAGCGHRCEYT